ncbi:hypothetical protein NLG97_g9761 [Lecanicillium saksenae]|uniref:Uncharacterized protein n=1 Tax=Lecanicillium saksenae TaxID=468837 RepID=A0ACC1QGS8_9HYPO|nr:hypothetical protein NLG97_g9761 [Lecanicillium saksenae]
MREDQHEATVPPLTAAERSQYFSARCKAEDDEFGALCSRINVEALKSRASALRNGIECSIEPIQHDLERRSNMGGMNYHIQIRFEDGGVWFARIRRLKATSPPPVVRDYILKSEVATLMFLETTAVPAPKVYDYALEQSDNPVGVGYILMAKLPGKPLDWPAATPDQRRKVMDQLADLQIEIFKYPLPVLGSMNTPGSAEIGGSAHEMLLSVMGDQLQSCSPFHLAEAHRTHILQLTLHRILKEEMYTQRCVDAYLIHRFLLDLVPKLTPAHQNTDGNFYLKHGDDKGDHILVDENFNITGVIDWEWAHTAAPADAFNSPIGLLPVADFYVGKGVVGEDEAVFAQILEAKGYGSLARHVLGGRLQHLFTFCCGFHLSDWDGFLGLFQGLRDASGVDAGTGWEEWKEAALNRYKDDGGLQELLIRCGRSGNGP